MIRIISARGWLKKRAERLIIVLQPADSCVKTQSVNDAANVRNGSKADIRKDRLLTLC